MKIRHHNQTNDASYSGGNAHTRQCETSDDYYLLVKVVVGQGLLHFQ